MSVLKVVYFLMKKVLKCVQVSSKNGKEYFEVGAERCLKESKLSDKKSSNVAGVSAANINFQSYL
jgi:hypothetical protein